MQHYLKIPYFALLLIFCGHPQASTQMSGLAVYEELNHPIFIGALFYPSSTPSEQQLLDNSLPRRMELRIIAPKISNRRFNKLWIEGAVVNNSQTVLTSQASNMVRFTRLFKKPMVSGDQINITELGADSTHIQLNGVTLGKIDAPDFFNLLLSTWIGNVPISSKYRDQLIGSQDINAGLLSQFHSIEPSVSRRLDVAEWQAPEVKQEHKPQPNHEQIKLAATPQIAQIKDTAPETAAIPKYVQKQKPESVRKPNPSDNKPIAEKSTEEAEEQIAQALLQRQLYHSDLIRKTYQHINYPSRAIDRQQQGSIRIEVTLDREGQITELRELEKSKHKLLNKAAIKSVKKASPFSAIPDSMIGEHFKFTLPIVFRLQ